MKPFTLLSILFALCAFSAVASATTVYSNTPNGSTISYMSLYTTAYGELVTLPSTQALQSFSFYLDGMSVAGNIDLEIAQWSASLNQAVGPIVYSSPSPTAWDAGTQTLTFKVPLSDR